MVSSFLANTYSLIEGSSLVEAAARLFARTEHAALVLRVGLHFSGPGPEVHFNLGQRDPAQEGERRVWKFPLDAVAGPTTLRRPPDPLALPAQLIVGLRDAVAAESLPADQPLWLDLLRPYGFLGILPWETALGDALNHPVLRLPSFLETPQENRDIADVALIVCADPLKNHGRTIQQVSRIANAVLAGSRRLQTRVHLFAPEPWLDSLLGAALGERVRVHAPPQGQGDPTGSVCIKDWTDWISIALDGQALDAVHFIGDAEPSSVGAMFMLAAPYRNLHILLEEEPEEDWPVTAASVEDLCAMLTRLGAWAMAFTPSTPTHADQALAFFADGAAHSRPGPLLYQRVDTQQDADEAVEGYRFLLSPEPSPAPRLSRGFLYGLPSAVAYGAVLRLSQVEAALDAALLAAGTVAERSPLTQRVLKRATELLPGVAVHEIQQAPNWASAAQRFMETATLDELRRLSGDVLLSRADAVAGWATSKTVDENTAVVMRTLSEIRDVISKHLPSGTSAVDLQAATGSPDRER